MSGLILPTSNQYLDLLREIRAKLGEISPADFKASSHAKEKLVESAYYLADNAIVAAEKSPVETSRDNETTLRRLLALVYSGASLYRDDGELQDGSELPVIDYLRDPVGVIESKMQERGLRRIQAARSAQETSARPAVEGDIVPEHWWRVHRELAKGHTSMALAVVAAVIEGKPLPECSACDVTNLVINAQKASACQHLRRVGECTPDGKIIREQCQDCGLTLNGKGES